MESDCWKARRKIEIYLRGYVDLQWRAQLFGVLRLSVSRQIPKKLVGEYGQAIQAWNQQ